MVTFAVCGFLYGVVLSIAGTSVRQKPLRFFALAFALLVITEFMRQLG